MLGAKNFPSMNILKETFDEMKTAKALEDCKIHIAGGQAIAVAGIENPEKILGQQYEPGYLTLRQVLECMKYSSVADPGSCVFLPLHTGWAFSGSQILNPYF
jgi:hypothetical protein